MKKIIIAIISANVYLPLIALCYRLGGPFELALIPLALIHIILFAVFLHKTWHHFLLSLNAVLSFCGGSVLSTWLYYCNVSDDPMTPIVGMYIALLAAVVLLVVTIVSAVIKHIAYKVSANQTIEHHQE